MKTNQFRKKYLAPVLLIITSILFTAAIAIAALPPNESIPKAIENNPIIALALLIMSCCNLGSTAYLVKRYMNKIDKDSEIIPELVSTVRSLTESANKIALKVDSHDHEITVVKTIHQLKGCDKAIISKCGT